MTYCSGKERKEVAFGKGRGGGHFYNMGGLRLSEWTGWRRKGRLGGGEENLKLHLGARLGLVKALPRIRKGRGGKKEKTSGLGERVPHLLLRGGGTGPTIQTPPKGAFPFQKEKKEGVPPFTERKISWGARIRSALFIFGKGECLQLRRDFSRNLSLKGGGMSIRLKNNIFSGFFHTGEGNEGGIIAESSLRSFQRGGETATRKKLCVSPRKSRGGRFVRNC